MLVNQLHDVFFTEISKEDSIVSPYRATLEELSNLAPAVFILGSKDALCSQGYAYANRLKEDGVATNVKVYEAGYGSIVGN